MDKVRIGIIGVGNMGTAHITSVQNIPQAELAAICDSNKKRADEKAKLAPKDCKVFYSTEELFNSGAIDAVIISVPHYDHTPVAIRAFEKGIHVLCEKPVAVTKSRAQQMIDAHAKHPDLRFALMFNQRTRQAHKKIKKLIEEGEFGKIVRVNWTVTDWFRSQSYYDSGSWRATWAGEGGGVLLNQCPHHLDLFQWFFGLPVKVRSTVSIGKYHDIEVEDDVNTYCEFADGSTGNFITSTGEFPGTNRLEISGTRGRMVFEDNVIKFKRTEVDVNEFCRTTPESFPSMDTWDVVIPSRKDSGHEHQDVIEAFVKAILDPKADLVAKGEEGIRSVEFGNAMLYSGLKGVEVTIPMDTVKFDAMLDDLIKHSKFQKKEVKAAVVDMGNSF
jgi:Predicted dehydrogenases and related proteins